jgi:hypothetical protein
MFKYANQIVSMKDQSTISKFIEIMVFMVFIPMNILYIMTEVKNGELFFNIYNKLVPLDSGINYFLTEFPGNDIYYQLKFAFDYINSGEISLWVLNLWPPGLPALFVAFIKLNGPDFFVLKYILFASLAYSLSMYIMYKSLAGRRFSIFFIILTIAPIYIETFRKSLIIDMQLFSSDLMSFVVMIVLFAAIINSRLGVLLRYTTFAISFSLLIYTRSYYYILFNYVVAVYLFLLVVYSAYMLRAGKFNLKSEGVKSLIRFGVFVCIVWLSLLPWKHQIKINGGDHKWTSTEQVWAAQWRNDIPSFLAAMNTPCIVKREICENLIHYQHEDTWAKPTLGSDFYKYLSIATFIFNPIDWYMVRSHFFQAFWFDQQTLSSIKDNSRYFNFAFSIALLFAVLGFTSYLFLKIFSGKFNFQYDRPLVIYCLFVLFNVIVFTFVHFEPRYSIPLKAATYYMIIYHLCSFMIKLHIIKNDENVLNCKLIKNDR